MRERLLRLRPPRIALALLAGAALLARWVPGLSHRWWSCPLAGVLALVAGFVVMMWAWLLFRRLGNPVCPTAGALTLIRSGPYRFSRNPMYLGMLLMLLAVFCWRGNPVFLAPPLLFFALLRGVFIPFEEAGLQQAFPEGFPRYRAATRRWL